MVTVESFSNYKYYSLMLEYIKWLIRKPKWYNFRQRIQWRKEYPLKNVR